MSSLDLPSGVPSAEWFKSEEERKSVLLAIFSEIKAESVWLRESADEAETAESSTPPKEDTLADLSTAVEGLSLSAIPVIGPSDSSGRFKPEVTPSKEKTRGVADQAPDVEEQAAAEPPHTKQVVDHATWQMLTASLKVDKGPQSAKIKFKDLLNMLQAIGFGLVKKGHVAYTFIPPTGNEASIPCHGPHGGDTANWEPQPFRLFVRSLKRRHSWFRLENYEEEV